MTHSIGFPLGTEIFIFRTESGEEKFFGISDFGTSRSLKHLIRTESKGSSFGVNWEFFLPAILTLKLYLKKSERIPMSINSITKTTERNVSMSLCRIGFSVTEGYQIMH